MEATQIYELVNAVAQQSLGREDVSVVDTASLVTTGNLILNSDASTESFIKTLVARIGKTIISYRKYSNQLAPLVMDDMEWGAVVQKITVEMPEVTEDQTFEIEDGQSVDMYEVKKPKANQKLFYKNTPYSCFITIQKIQLKEAFLGASQMGSFVSAIFGQVKNALELATENLSRLTMNNFMALTAPAQQVNLVSMYNALNLGNTVTAASAFYDEKFLRYAIGQMNLYSRKMKTLSTLYNGDGKARFTPDDKQLFGIINDFQTAMETQVQYAAFHESLVSKKASIEVPFWQGHSDPMKIAVEVEDGLGGKKAVELDNIIGFIFDRDALGTYRREEEVLTTPMNARGRYTNTFWHDRQMWFNDLSENGIIFTLN